MRPGRPASIKGLQAGAIGSFLAVNVGEGHSSRYISTDQQFGPDTTPGIDRQTNFWRGGGFVDYDWRDRSTRRSSGGKYCAQYVRYMSRDLDGYDFFRVDLHATQYIPLFNRTHVITLNGASSLTNATDNQRVPFYLQPTLGGPDTLRGYRVFRFYGNNSTMVNAEYRWELSPILDMVAFADGGKVFDRWEQWNLHANGKRRRIRPAPEIAVQSSFQYRQWLQPRGVSNMVSRQQYVLAARKFICLAAVVMLSAPAPSTAGERQGRKFYADDPLWREPAPRPVNHVAPRKVDDIYDFLENSYVTPRREGKEAKRTPHAGAGYQHAGRGPG